MLPLSKSYCERCKNYRHYSVGKQDIFYCTIGEDSIELYNAYVVKDNEAYNETRCSAFTLNKRRRYKKKGE